MIGDNYLRRIIILFDQYPFESGEYSFVQTELEMLVENFEVCIISVSPSAEQKMVTDKRISVYRCAGEFGIKEKLEAVIKFILSKCGRDEIKQIIKERQNIAGRLYDSVAYFGLADQMRKFVKKNDIIRGGELVYSYWFNANCLAFLMNQKKHSGMKVVSRIHGYDLYNERNPHNRQPFREYMDRMIDKIFFVADAGLQYYVAHWGETENIGSKYIVAPIGTTCIDFQKGGNFSGEKKYFHIVSCSHVIPLKRVALIIDSLALVTDMEIRWTHFGTGSHYDETAQYARKMLSQKNNISYEMVGFVPVEEIKRFYAEQNVDCFLTVSSTEGSPVSIQEALAYGIPIIGTAVGEIPHMIEGNGILLSENPLPEEVLEAIERLCSATEEETRRMHEKSREIWESKYNAVENAEKFVSLVRAEHGLP